MIGFDVLAVSGLLWLASGQAAPAGVRCTVPKAPVVSILTHTDEIAYDFTKTSVQLSTMKSNTVSPYAPNVDASTGGLRHDQPKLSLDVSWGTMTWPREKMTCFWYEKVEVKISLQPKIYIAKDFAFEPCKSAVLEHEIKHVKVDREVMNKFAVNIGKSIEAVVNKAGAMGPYKSSDSEAVKKKLVGQIQTAMNAQQRAMEQEMTKKQAQVDTLEEYERVSKICRDVSKKKKK